MTRQQQPLSRQDARYREIRRVTLIGSVIDLVLGVVKIVVGWLAHSQALVADGIHSLSDLATDFMVLYAAKHASKDADEEHPYGHGRIETVATVALGVALVAVAFGLAWDAVGRLFHPDELLEPGGLALAVAAVSVVAKEWIYHYTLRCARRLRSDMLRANAWHSRSDAISSIVVMVGVGGTMAGLPYLDAIAAVGVALMIARIGWDLAWGSIHELIDTGLEAEMLEDIRRTIRATNGVKTLHMLRSRRMGGEALVDVHIQVSPRVSVSEGHQIGEAVRQRLIGDFDEIADVMVHVDPEDDERHAPCAGLPLRDELLERLRQGWQHIPAAGHVEDVTLHYLDGKVNVEVLLPLSVLGDLDQTAEPAAELAAEFAAVAEGIDEVRSIQPRYH